MGNLIQFSAILISILGVFVTLFITMLKFNRNSVTKDDLNNSIESLRSEMNKRFEEVNKRLDEATADRARIEKEAAVDRQKIRDEAVANRQEIRDEAVANRQEIKAEMSSGFAQARDERKEIKREIIRQNQNYIEHLAHHNTPKANPVSEEDDST